MKCTKIQRIIVEYDESELSPDIHQHLTACPECDHAFHRACACRQLISLKRYEIPSELAREQCLTQLHDRLVQLQEGERRAVLRHGVGSHHALRYGIAAALVALVALHVTALRQVPSLRSAITDRDLTSRTFEQYIADRNRQIMLGTQVNSLFSTTSTLPGDELLRTSTRPPRRAPSVFVTNEEDQR